jgi:hypothetical protein
LDTEKGPQWRGRGLGEVMQNEFLTYCLGIWNKFEENVILGDQRT